MMGLAQFVKVGDFFLPESMFSDGKKNLTFGIKET